MTAPTRQELAAGSLENAARILLEAAESVRAGREVVVRSAVDRAHDQAVQGVRLLLGPATRSATVRVLEDELDRLEGEIGVLRSLIDRAPMGAEDLPVWRLKLETAQRDHEARRALLLKEVQEAAARRSRRVHG